MKSANWISATGIRPLSAAPIATPTMDEPAPPPRGGGRFGEQVPLEVGGVGMGRRLGGPDRLVHLGRAALLQPLVALVVEQPLVEQVVAEPLDRVAAEQRLQLLLGPVA